VGINQLVPTVNNYTPGVLADVVKLHMDYYHPNWGFGLEFETKLMHEMAEFFNRFVHGEDLFLSIHQPDGQCIGSISVDFESSNDKGAHIRWFIVNQSFDVRGITCCAQAL